MPVTLDPDAAAVLKSFREAGRPPYESLTPQEARDAFLMSRAVSNPIPPELASVRAVDCQGPAGAIPARLYTPWMLRKANGVSPCLVFFHGGGWVIGDLDSHDVVCRSLAHQGEMIVIAVDYRLAPENKFPAAADDAIASTSWIAANASSLGVDASRISIGGDSAGGNLAAVVAINSRESGPKIAGQVLIYPATDFGMAHHSHSEPEVDCLLTRAAVRWFRDHYLNSADDIDNWRGSPARVTDLSGLPPAYVLTVGADPLRDEGNEYASRLASAGVNVMHKTYPGQFHGFITMGKILPKATEALQDIGSWLRALG